jgi:thymidylate synthase (FAD)
MNVELVSISKPLNDMTPEQFIAYVARVSNPSNQLNIETAPKLLKYCMDHGHWSIFETVTCTFEIKTSRAIAAQILRHRSFTFQEFSQRYASVAEFETYNARRQDTKNRQNSIDDLPQDTKEWFIYAQKQVSDSAYELYVQALSKGVAKEQARFLLPLSTQTKLYMTGSIRSWIHYLNVRTTSDTQLEHREIAIEIKEKLKLHFPNIFNNL